MTKKEILNLPNEQLLNPTKELFLIADKEMKILETKYGTNQPIPIKEWEWNATLEAILMNYMINSDRPLKRGI